MLYWNLLRVHVVFYEVWIQRKVSCISAILFSPKFCETSFRNTFLKSMFWGEQSISPRICHIILGKALIRYLFLLIKMECQHFIFTKWIMNKWIRTTVETILIQNIPVGLSHFCAGNFIQRGIIFFSAVWFLCFRPEIKYLNKYCIIIWLFEYFFRERGVCESILLCRLCLSTRVPTFLKIGIYSDNWKTNSNCPHIKLVFLVKYNRYIQYIYTCISILKSWRKLHHQITI